jgi:hypothetical protein
MPQPASIKKRGVAGSLLSKPGKQELLHLSVQPQKISAEESAKMVQIIDIRDCRVVRTSARNGFWEARHTLAVCRYSEITKSHVNW